MVKALVVYYDDNEYRAKVCNSDTPDSSVAWVWGLNESDQIIAVVVIPPRIDWESQCQVFIDEQEIKL